MNAKSRTYAETMQSAITMMEITLVFADQDTMDLFVQARNQKLLTNYFYWLTFITNQILMNAKQPHVPRTSTAIIRLAVIHAFVNQVFQDLLVLVCNMWCISGLSNSLFSQILTNALSVLQHVENMNTAKIQMAITLVLATVALLVPHA